jgi:hypothetical protein
MMAQRRPGVTLEGSDASPPGPGWMPQVAVARFWLFARVADPQVCSVPSFGR